MSLVGRFFWIFCLWIPPLICLEDYLAGNDVDPVRAWHEVKDAFKSRFPKEPTKEDIDGF